MKERTLSNKMKSVVTTGLVVTIIISLFTLPARADFTDRPLTNGLFNPTAHTLRQGEFIIGLGNILFGITDDFHVGTNLLLYIFQIYNAGAKIHLIESGDTDLGLTFSFASFSLSGTSDEGEETDLDFSFISPGMVVSHKFSGTMGMHLGGQYSYNTSDYEVDETEVTSSAASGTSVYLGLEKDISPRTKVLGEVGYDITYEGLRFGGGFIMGWDKFRLKLGLQHFSGSNEAGDYSFVFPVIGLWWRFMG